VGLDKWADAFCAALDVIHLCVGVIVRRYRCRWPRCLLLYRWS